MSQPWQRFEIEFARLFRDSLMGVFFADSDGRLLLVNPAFCRMLGRGLDELASIRLDTITDASDVLRERALAAEMRDGRRRSYALDKKVLASDRSVRHLRTSVTRVDGDDGSFAGFLAQCVDVSGEAEALAAQHDAEDRYRNVVENMSEIVFETDEAGRFTFLNGAWQESAGVPVKRTIGLSAFDFIHPEDRPIIRAGFDSLMSGEAQTRRMEMRYANAHGRIAWAEVRARALRDAHGIFRGIAGVLSDVTDRKVAEERLTHQALHDALTGLPNRRLLLDRLGHALQRAGRSGHQVAVLFIDLDHFKVVNDSLGHDVGDALLRGVGERIVGAIRSGETVARLGGDEFVVVAEAVGNADEAHLVAKRVRAALDAPIAAGGRLHRVGASIGLVVTAGGSLDPNSVIADADLAMYRAKERGRNRIEPFEDGLRRAVIERLTLEEELRVAIERGELTPYYQPVVDVRTGDIVGAEALLRWHHPERGLLRPDAFLATAEETGLIDTITDQLLDVVLRHARRWPGLVVSVNVSARQLVDAAFPDRVARLVAKHQVAPGALSFEVNENGVLADPGASDHVLRRLHELGVGISLDDFGTGFSALSHLRDLPVSQVKVHRSFVAGLGQGDRSEALVGAVVAMAHAIGVAVVAEGVESARQLVLLRSMGCDLAQGFLFAAESTEPVFHQLVQRGERLPNGR